MSKVTTAQLLAIAVLLSVVLAHVDSAQSQRLAKRPGGRDFIGHTSPKTKRPGGRDFNVIRKKVMAEPLFYVTDGRIRWAERRRKRPGGRDFTLRKEK